VFIVKRQDEGGRERERKREKKRGPGRVKYLCFGCVPHRCWREGSWSFNCCVVVVRREDGSVDG